MKIRVYHMEAEDGTIWVVGPIAHARHLDYLKRMRATYPGRVMTLLYAEYYAAMLEYNSVGEMLGIVAPELKPTDFQVKAFFHTRGIGRVKLVPDPVIEDDTSLEEVLGPLSELYVTMWNVLWEHGLVDGEGGGG
jgi:hypothetical protein